MADNDWGDDYDEEFGYDRNEDGDAVEDNFNQYSSDSLNFDGYSDSEDGNLDGMSYDDEGELSAEELIAQYEASLDGQHKSKIVNSMEAGDKYAAARPSDIAEGLADMKTIKETQLEHHPIAVQYAFKQAVEGRFDGRKGGFDEISIAAALEQFREDTGVDPSQISQRIRKDQMPSKVKKVDPSVYGNYMMGTGQKVPYRSKFVAPASKQTANLLYGYLTKTDDFVQRGVGQALPGNHMLDSDTPAADEGDWRDQLGTVDFPVPGDVTGGASSRTMERRKAEATAADLALAKARATISHVAGLYIPEATKERGGKLLEGRQRRVEELITGRFMDSTAWDGAETALALPNEMGVMKEGDSPMTGLVRTAAWSGSQGTPYTRVEWANVEHEFEEGSREWKQHIPSLRNSLMPVDWEAPGDPLKARDAKWDALMADVTAARAVIRKETITTQDESYGNEYRSTGWYKPSGQQQESMGYWEEGNMLDLDLSGDLIENPSRGGQRSAAAIVGKRPSIFADVKSGPNKGKPAILQYRKQIENAKNIDSGNINGEGHGSDRANMYGEKGASQMSVFVSARESGLSLDEAHAVATGNARVEDYLDSKGNRVMTMAEEALDPDAITASVPTTDRERYLADIAANPRPKQGEKEWLAQRKGKVTASLAGSLHTKQADLKMASLLGKERFLGKDKFRGNADTREGNNGEKKAIAAFLAMQEISDAGIEAEEAFFETHKDYKNIGASPDARLFNPDGSSAGLLEVKFLSPKRMKGARNKYYNQMQMQMAVSGETKTHFYALDKHTNDYVYEVVEADPEYQELLIGNANKALDIADSLRDVRDLDDMRNRITSSARRKSKNPVTGSTKAFRPTVDTRQTATAWRPSAEKQESMYNEAVGKVMGQGGQEQVGDLMVALKGITEAAQAEEEAKKKLITATDQETANKNDAAREQAEAAKKAAHWLDVFSNALSDASDALLKGNESGMGELALAADLGIDAGKLRGARDLALKSGMNDKTFNKAMKGAGKLQSDMNNEITAASTWTSMLEAQGVSNLQEVRNLNFGTAADLKGMDAVDLAAKIRDLMKGLSPEAQKEVGKIWGGTQGLAVARDLSGDSLRGSKNDRFDDRVDGFYATRSGVAQGEIWARDAKESFGSVEGNGGFAAGVSAVAYKEFESLKSSGPLSKALMGTGLGAYTATSMAADKLGVAPKSGLFDPVFKTMDNIRVGFGDKEALDRLNSIETTDFSIPSSASEARAILNSNVNVNVEVKPGSVETDTDNNGERYIDVQNHYGDNM